MSGSVLVVDDALFSRTVIREIIQQTSGRYSLAGEAANGLEAVEMYEKDRPDIVTMDIVMPELDGIAAIRAITRSDPNARIIVCSAMGQEALLTEALDAGAKDFMVKPITSEKLLPALDRLSDREARSWT